MNDDEQRTTTSKRRSIAAVPRNAADVQSRDELRYLVNLTDYRSLIIGQVDYGCDGEPLRPKCEIRRCNVE